METTKNRTEKIKEQVIEALRTVYDPEIPVDIYEMGLVYDIAVGQEGNIKIQMTLTSPQCPVAEDLPIEVDFKVRSIPDVRDVKVDVVWDPPWDPSKMSEAAQLELGWF